MTSAEPGMASGAGPASGAGDRTRALRTARLGLHGITVVLVGVSVLRAVQQGAPLWAAAGVGILLLGCYAAGAGLRDRRRAMLWLGALTAVWLGALLLSPDFVWVSFPLLLVSGHLLRGAAGAVGGAGIVAAAIAVPWAMRGETSTPEVLGPVIGGAFALGMARLYSSLLADADEHRRLVASLVAAGRETDALQAELARVQREAGASEERTRIARDIHDTIAQEFSSISLLARGGVDDEAAARIDAVARRGAEDARRIVRALLPAELEASALGEALERLARGFAAESGIPAGFAADPLRPLGTGAEVALLRTLQTALANIRAHAAASRVGVELREVGDEVRLDVVDDGCGFDIAAWERTGGGGVSVGLREARERLRELGGGLDIESGPGEGTALSAWVPRGAPLRRASTSEPTGATRGGSQGGSRGAEAPS
ncbi:sensor histidine kinase [Leucobacter sp. CSA1]|uniref:Oxygen sensor histidine kinase NreB n=1 Tax=Leucobacter chromiisoli TaxID=2796471 RepID=A0A934UU07_9MICO|nr:sensor histidine kinase [Leucobacter chromiisoli]MBK0418310.1 sensor histidine kinase [Leucobacter chromiisoli]